MSCTTMADWLVNCWIPVAPISMNALHQIIYSQRRVELKPEVRLWKTQVQGFLPIPNLSDTDLLHLSTGFFRCEVEMWNNWYFKNQTPRKLDVQNLLKVLLDTVAARYGFDDSRLWSVSAVKVQSAKVGMQVRLGLWPETA